MHFIQRHRLIALGYFSDLLVDLVVLYTGVLDEVVHGV